MKYRISFNGSVDVEAETREEAETKFFTLTDQEVGSGVVDFYSVTAVKERKTDDELKQ